MAISIFIVVGVVLSVASLLAISESIILFVDIVYDVNAIKRGIQGGEKYNMVTAQPTMPVCH